MTPDERLRLALAEHRAALDALRPVLEAGVAEARLELARLDSLRSDDAPRRDRLVGLPTLGRCLEDDGKRLSLTAGRASCEGEARPDLAGAES